MLQQGDIAYIIKTPYTSLPSHLYGLKAEILREEPAAYRVNWTGPLGKVWVVQTKKHGAFWLHELELIKHCAKR